MNKTKAFKFVISAAVVFAAVFLNAFTLFGSVTTTEPAADSEGVYQISSPSELYWFAAYVNKGNTAANAVLTADITLNTGNLSKYNGTDENSWTEWTPIGSSANKYEGTFDGQNHTIKGIYYNDKSYIYVGLFGCSNGGTIENIVIDNSYISADQGVGAFCGRANNNTTIKNCQNKGTISGYAYIGGICGEIYSNSIISGCSNKGNITNEYYQYYGKVGGICGNVSSSAITDCYNSGTISGITSAGGICGSAYANVNTTDITNCYNIGIVSANSEYNGVACGGICGSAGYGAIIENCYNKDTISGSSSIGGICGSCRDAEIKKCYNTGIISGNYYIGGICGSNNGTVTSCYYLTDSAGGGINGSDAEGSAEVKTADEFASGEVTWLLNGETSKEAVWYQTLGTDSYPVFSGKIVYKDDSGYINIGDVWVDNIIDEKDAEAILKITAGIDIDGSVDEAAADVNRDGSADVIDAVEILKCFE